MPSSRREINRQLRQSMKLGDRSHEADDLKVLLNWQGKIGR